MSKYFKANEVINAIEDKIAEYIPTLYGRYGEIPLELRMTIEHLTGIELVRCQDCKYWVYNFNGCSRNPCTEPWYATDFCSYGERKEE